jgi:hypothetical protein
MSSTHRPHSRSTAWTILGREPSEVTLYASPDYATPTTYASPGNPVTLEYFQHQVYMTDGVGWFVANAGGWQAVAGAPWP